MEGFCTHCGFEVETFEGLTACPSCGTTNVPCNLDNQVTVSINWHELHILCVWAENYQRQEPTCGKVVYAIADRLEKQYPDKWPLTLAKEVGELSKKYEISVSSPELRQDIAEQTGEETGLFRMPDDAE